MQTPPLGSPHRFVRHGTNARSAGRSYGCEERSDEAISTPTMGDCFASLAMTYRVLSSGFAFALRLGSLSLVHTCGSFYSLCNPSDTNRGTSFEMRRTAV